MNLKIVVLILAYIALVNADPWGKYKERFGKNFKNRTEENRRHRKFDKNLERIIEINRDYKQGTSTYYTEVNDMAAMLPEEIKNYTGLVHVQESRRKRDVDLTEPYVFRNWPNAPIHYNFNYDPKVRVSQNIDYRTKWRRAADDQKTCGSCWAFAAAAAIDANYKLQMNIDVQTSQQELVDCSGSFGTFGCDGGNAWDAFDYIMLNQTALSSAYSYTASQGVCNSIKRFSNRRIGLKGYVAIYGKSPEEALKQAVAKYGACVVYAQITGSFFAYKGGLYNGRVNGRLECSSDPTQTNHAMVVVGYGTNSTFGDYWIVRNSWGPNWGSNGHVFMQRGVQLCGIGLFSKCPILTEY